MKKENNKKTGKTTDKKQKLFPKFFEKKREKLAKTQKTISEVFRKKKANNKKLAETDKIYSKIKKTIVWFCRTL